MDPVERLRELCLALPEVTERLNHGEPAWSRPRSWPRSWGREWYGRF
ncbi:hypothetical protein [Amycolatopsis sp. NPDC059657]